MINLPEWCIWETEKQRRWLFFPAVQSSCEQIRVVWSSSDARMVCWHSPRVIKAVIGLGGVNLWVYCFCYFEFGSSVCPCQSQEGKSLYGASYHSYNDNENQRLQQRIQSTRLHGNWGQCHVRRAGILKGYFHIWINHLNNYP